MKHLVPLMTYLSPFFTAVVRMPETSEPASGSVRQKEASLGSSVSMPEVLLLDLLGAAERHGGAGQAVAHQRGADAGAAPAELLLDQAAGQVVEPRAAVLLGDVGVHQAHLPGLLDDLLREGAVLVVVPGHRADLLLGEVVRELANVLLLVGEGEVDQFPLPIDSSVNPFNQGTAGIARRPSDYDVGGIRHGAHRRGDRRGADRRRLLLGQRRHLQRARPRGRARNAPRARRGVRAQPRGARGDPPDARGQVGPPRGSRGGAARHRRRDRGAHPARRRLAGDPALREEVRQLVVARNERRRRQGEEPLDVEAEVDRQLHSAIEGNAPGVTSPLCGYRLAPIMAEGRAHGARRPADSPGLLPESADRDDGGGGRLARRSTARSSTWRNSRAPTGC